jgi:DNA/RNA-binding domain of Phe-tRNA-synthetase-like protein
MELSIDPKVASEFPGTTLGVVEGACIANKLVNEAEFAKEKQAAEEAARAIPVLSEHPNMAAWRAVFRKFGADPTKTRSSAEAMVRRIQKGDSIPEINAIVDVYNTVSAKRAIPIGGQDADAITGRMVLRFAKADDLFFPLGSTEPVAVSSGEVVYADDKHVLCSKWNYRDCEPAKIDDETTRFVLVVDGAPGIAEETVKAATAELAGMLEKYVEGCKCGWRIVKS